MLPWGWGGGWVADGAPRLLLVGDVLESGRGDGCASP